MSLYFQTDKFPLMCGIQSRERWSASQNRLDTSLGEKAAELHTPNFSTPQFAQPQSNMIGRETATLDMGSTGHQEGWTECFQDLHTWCPPPQDELNTPQVTTECFNFGTFDQGQVKGLDDLYPADLMADTLGGDMAYLEPVSFIFEEGNNNSTPLSKLPQTSNALAVGDGKLHTSFPTNFKSPLKSTSANVLLSQSILPTATKVKVKTEAPMDFQFGDGIPYDLAEDEENFLSVPPEQVARRVQEFRVPSRTDVAVKKERPKLKLDITLPNTPSNVVMPSTPEVQNVLSEPKVGFDLINYVVSGDYVNAASLGGVTPISKVYESVERDHDYIDPGMRPALTLDQSFFIKSEPESPDDRVLPTIHEDKIDRDATPTTERRPVKRRRDSNSDYVFDSDLDNSDNSVDWEPTKTRAKKPKVKKAKNQPNKEPVRHDSDAESIASSYAPDKYRELRDKNNEASRRSRMNRKQRDLETRKTAEKLEAENRALRARAERMQKLVLEMRETIMRTIKGSKKR